MVRALLSVHPVSGDVVIATASPHDSHSPGSIRTRTSTVPARNVAGQPEPVGGVVAAERSCSASNPRGTALSSVVPARLHLAPRPAVPDALGDLASDSGSQSTPRPACIPSRSSSRPAPENRRWSLMCWSCRVGSCVSGSATAARCAMPRHRHVSPDLPLCGPSCPSSLTQRPSPVSKALHRGRSPISPTACIPPEARPRARQTAQEAR